jgi:hypothetical protein
MSNSACRSFFSSRRFPLHLVDPHFQRVAFFGFAAALVVGQRL